MSPRITALVRFVIITGLVCLLAPAMFAQTCAPPTLVTEPDVCLGANGHAYVSEGNFASYQWSIVNGTVTYGAGTSQITFVPAGTGDVELTVVTTDGSSCQSQSSATVPIGTPAPPVIELAEASLCPGVNAPGGYASLAAPPMGTTYITTNWTITNGTIVYSYGDYVTFNIDGTAPAELTVHVTDNRGCQTSSSVTVPVRTLDPPVIELYEPSVCPGSSAMGGYATVAAPPAGVSYTSYEWQILHGTIEYGNTGSGVTFKVTGSTPVELSVKVRDDRGCEATSSVNVPIRTLAPPVIELYEPSVCPGSEAMGGYATVAAPPAGTNYASYEWQILNGSFPYGNTGSSVTFKVTGSTPVELSVKVRDDRGCEATASVDVPIRTIPPPQISLYEPSVCPGSEAMGGYATVAPPPAGIQYQSYEWSIINGSFPYGNTSSSVSYKATGNGTVELSVKVRDSRGCLASSSVDIPIRTIPPPQIDLYEPSVCPSPAGMGGYATAAPPPAGIQYQSFQWSIVNGTLPYSSTSSSVSFTANGNAPVELTLTVRDGYGCISTSSVTVPIRTLAPPEIVLGDPRICPGPGPGSYATVGPPPAGTTYMNFEWSILHGHFGGDNHGSSVSFEADGTGPVELTLLVRDSRGCAASKTVTVPLGADPPEITLDQPTFCSTEPHSAHISSMWRDNIVWTVTNGTILSGQGTRWIDFAATGAGPVTVSVTANNYRDCPGTNSIVMPSSVPPVPIFAPATACVGSLQKVSGETVNGQSNFNWTITNATVEGPTNQRELYFRANGNGPVAVSVTAMSWQGCPTANSITIPLGPMPVPQIQTNIDRLCPGAWVNAYFYAPDDVFGNVNWTVTNATNIQTSGSSVSFQHIAGAGDVTITANVGEGNCTASASKVMQVVQAPTPVLSIASTTMCEGSTNQLTFENYSTFTQVYVSVINGVVTNELAGPGAAGRRYNIRATGSGVMTINVWGDANGCVLNGTKTVNVLAAPASITPSGATTFCAGGSVTLTANAGSSYTWSNGATTQSIAVSTTGTYTVTVRQPNGCSNTASRSVTVNPLPGNIITASGPTTFCEGGSVTLTAPAGVSYTWSNGATTPSINVSTAGTYTVTVRSSAGCLRTSNPVTVVVNPKPAAGITATQVYDGGSGTITRTGDTIQACGNPTVRLVPALNAQYTYAWSTGANTAVLDVTASGTYTVTVTTPQGCSTASSVTVNYAAIPQKPAIAASATELCPAGGTVTLTAPAADGWTWSNGATTQSITVATAGSYTVRTRVGACDSPLSDPVVITNGTSTINYDNLFLCEPGTSVILGAAGGTSWLWSNGATTSSITVTEPGSYSVTTTNGGCTMAASAPVTVTRRAVTVDASGPLSFCSGDSVTLTASGGHMWTWSNGATTQSITVSQSGTYSVVARFPEGCLITSAPVTVEARSVATTITADRTSVCSGGAIQLSGTATGGSGYSYQWYDNTYAPIAGATSPNLTIHPTASGFVYLKVTDALGCLSTSNSVIYSVVPAPDATITAADAICQGASASASVPYVEGNTYAWTISNGTLNFPSSPAVTFSPNGTQPVTLTVTVTNAGCSVTSSKTVAVNALPVAAITPSGATTFCEGGNVTLTASNGASYLWSNGATTSSITVSAAGSYSVTVTNAAGCSTTSAATVVTVNANPVATINASGPTTFCEGGNVTLTASAGASYLWSNGATTQSITVSDAGSYSVTVTNANGCSTTSAATAVTLNANPTATITASGATTFCEGGNVTLTASSGAFYLWSNGATTSSITVSAAGNYSVTVTNAIGCSTTSAATAVTVNANPVATISASGATTFCEGGSVTLTASSGASYLWSNGATTQSITVSDAGSYSVTVTNANGCSTTSAATAVTINANPTAAITAAGPTTFCEGGNVTLTASSGASYLWSNGATTSSITVNASGNYSVTVTNAAGCSTTSAATAVTVNANPVASITASGPTSFCDGGNVTLTASNGTSYLWSNGATTQSITVNAAGSYSVTVSNANGCSMTSAATAVTVNANPIATISASGATTFCAGGNVTLTASAGASYLWSNGATTPSIAVNASGSYSVTVTNAAGCSTTSAATAVTVNANPIATITASGATTFCEGGNVTLTASDGTSYLWSNGATTQSITVSAAGSYSVTVSNANGCSTTSAATAVTVNPNPIATITAGGATTFCEGGNVTLTASSGASYLWSNGATTSSITVNAAGNYSVTVTNANGCSTTSAATAVTVNANPVATITPSGPTTFCTGGNVTLTASAGTSYLWSNGATTPSITVSAAGNYTVRVTNANGCSTTSAATAVTVNALPTATTSAGGPTTFCAGGSVTLSASAGASWLWSNGATTQSINVTTGGSYTVTVTNANGCSATSSPRVVTVNPLPTPSISASGPTTFCVPGSVTLTGQGGSGTWYRDGAFYSSATSIIINTAGSWSFTYRITTNGCMAESQPVLVTGNVSPTITSSSGFASVCWNATSAWHEVANPPAGSTIAWSITGGSILSGATDARVYYAPAAGSTNVGLDVAITNTAGCSIVRHYDVPVDRATPTISANGPTTFCTGGSVTLSMPTAPAGWFYIWSNGATTQSITVSTNGTYIARYYRTQGGCTGPASDPVTVNVTPLPSATITPSGPTTFCEGGSVTLTAPASASYAWSNGATTQSIVANAAGSYSVTVTNANGCSATSAATNVTVNAKPTPTITANGPTTFCDGNSVTLTASAGSSYLWSNGATTSSILVTSAGNYSVTVTNANGCSATSAPTAVDIIPAVAASISASGPTTFCEGGSVTLTAPAGAASYLWSNGATSQSINVSTAGSYSVTVNSANGCSSTSSSTTVTVNPVASPSISASGPTTFCTPGSVTLTGQGGSGTWYRDGASFSTAASITISTAGSWTFTYRITNASGCTTTSQPVIVTANATTPISQSSGYASACWNETLWHQVTNPPAGATFLWTITNGSIVSGATDARVYYTPGPNATSVGLTVTMTNSAGCPVSSHFDIPVDRPTPTVTASGATTFCQGGSVTLTAAAAPSGWGYVWSNNTFNQSVTVNASGTYTVSYSKLAGSCVSPASDPVTVTVNALPAATITPSGPTTFCTGGNVTLTASAGASYLWSTGATTQSINVTSSGNYSVTVTSASGCSTLSAPTGVTVNSAATPTISGPSSFCQGGSATLTASSGSSYLWSNGVTTQSINVTAGGNYTVTVTQANGCSAISAAKSVTMNAAPSTPAITPSGATTFCAGGSVTLNAPAGFSSYLWSNGATTQSINVNATGNYTVTVTNASGCSATSAPQSVTVNAATGISAQPQNITVPRNATATLNVTASGTGPFTYQWYRGTAPSTATPVTGVTTVSSYTPPKLTKGTYTYWVRVTGTCGAVNSTTATVTAN